ncbi:hypothetical protein HNY73_006702 [Argiope bruennichi]|uniref:Uncharacterized protein n=1 Tax=Argiope bruennichi TaxID=94029 RepID=A0A8T0FGU6_ARGBR|nr:hypothetical protein HNY73_006702 [Argiope bruennichi]
MFATLRRNQLMLVSGTMAEPEELRVDSPEHLALPSESSSRRARSQSVSIPLDHDYLREIGISLRRLSNDFENRLAERNRQRRRSSLAQYFYW